MVRHSHSRYARGVSADGRVQPPTIRRYDISTYLCSKHQRTCVRKREPRKQWTRTDDIPMTVEILAHCAPRSAHRTKRSDCERRRAPETPLLQQAIHACTIRGSWNGTVDLSIGTPVGFIAIHLWVSLLEISAAPKYFRFYSRIETQKIQFVELVKCHSEPIVPFIRSQDEGLHDMESI